jgi:hypothetical protein
VRRQRRRLGPDGGVEVGKLLIEHAEARGQHAQVVVVQRVVVTKRRIVS